MQRAGCNCCTNRRREGRSPPRPPSCSDVGTRRRAPLLLQHRSPLSILNSSHRTFLPCVLSTVLAAPRAVEGRGREETLRLQSSPDVCCQWEVTNLQMEKQNLFFPGQQNSTRASMNLLNCCLSAPECVRGRQAGRGSLCVGRSRRWKNRTPPTAARSLCLKTFGLDRIFTHGCNLFSALSK